MRRIRVHGNKAVQESGSRRENSLPDRVFPGREWIGTMLRIRSPPSLSLAALSLAVWFGWVSPANAVLATWQPGPIPEDFAAIRNRWETGHVAVAALKLIGFMATVLAIAPRTRPLPEASRSR